MKKNFYCQKICGEEDFSIDEWNKSYEELEKLNLSEKERTDILFPPAYTNQCFDCMAIVGKTRLKTKELLKKRNNTR